MKIIIGTVVHKKAFEYKDQFVKALNAQTYDEFEVLIINDGLSDNMMNFYTENIKNKCHVVRSNDGNSISDNRIQLIEACMNHNAEYLILGDSDDRFDESRIEILVRSFNSQIGFYYNDLLYDYEFKKVFQHLPEYVTSVKDISEMNFLGLSNTAINLSCIDSRILNVLKGFSIDVFDWFLYSVLVLFGIKGKYVSGTNVYYNVHNENLVGQQIYTEELIRKELNLKLELYKYLSKFSSFYEMLLCQYRVIERYPIKLHNKKIDYWWGYIKAEDYIRRYNLVHIKDKVIANYSKPYIIAEIGSNHNGDMKLAKQLIDKAVEVGVDAVKFQSWDDKSLIAQEEYDNNRTYDDSPKKHFGSLKEMVEKYYLRKEQHYFLKEYCDEKGVVFCSTPFSIEEVDLLEDVGVPFYKVASMDINNYRLLKHIAKKGKPIVLSTGMASFAEIEAAIQIIEEEGNQQIIILHCISIYPPDPKDINLRNIKMMQKMYPHYPVGFSDHTIGTSIPIAAVTLGAALIEKHFTIDKDLPGWDHEISADPIEMRYIVEESKTVCKALGNYKRIVSDAENEKKLKFRRSIVLKRDMKEGEKIFAKDITFKRPGTGFSPDMEYMIIGRMLSKDKKCDDVLRVEDFK